MSNNDKPRVILSAFADEAANQKTAVQQFAALAALGLQYYSMRFIDAGGGIKNVMKLTLKEIQQIRHLEDEYGLNVASIGSPIGKVKLVDVDDGTKNAYVPFKKYLEKDVKKACELAHAFETKLIRGFSFYHPKGTDPREHLSQAVDQLGQIAEACHRSDLTFGLEIEGEPGGAERPNHGRDSSPGESSGDGARFSTPRIFSARATRTAEVYEQYLAMKPAIGWMHIKDYVHPRPPTRQGHVDEDALEALRARRHRARRSRMDSARLPRAACRSSRTSCAAAAFPACFSIWSRT